jgi:hypothetical protein
MAHFTQLDENNIVIQIIVVSNDEILENGQESEAKGIAFCESLFGGKWIQTSYNSRIRKNYAGIGFTYDPIRDAFIPPKPFESWSLNENSCQWESPERMPSEAGFYEWIEADKCWIQVNSYASTNI